MRDNSQRFSAELKTVRHLPGAVREEVLLLATEVPFGIIANGEEIATLMCSPAYLTEFVYGFLYTSRFIDHSREITSCDINREQWKAEAVLTRPVERHKTGSRIYTAGCGQGVIYYTEGDLPDTLPQSQRTFRADEVRSIMERFHKATRRKGKARGLHTAAFFFGREEAVFMEDVGRHNAVDKVIGWALLHNKKLPQGILVTSGRVSSEILHKAARSEIPLVISIGSPTHHAVLLARNIGLTLIGVARGRNFTVFNGNEKII